MLSDDSRRYSCQSFGGSNRDPSLHNQFSSTAEDGAAIGVLRRVFESALMGTVSAVGHAGTFVGGLVVIVGAVCFFIGLLVRGAQFIATRDPRAARERASRERAMRQRVRRPAEGAPPLNDQPEHVADSDPAVGENEEER